MALSENKEDGYDMTGNSKKLKFTVDLISETDTDIKNKTKNLLGKVINYAPPPHMRWESFQGDEIVSLDSFVFQVNDKGDYDLACEFNASGKKFFAKESNFEDLEGYTVEGVVNEYLGDETQLFQRVLKIWLEKNGFDRYSKIRHERVIHIYMG